MTEHLLIESGGPASGPACERFLRDAARLASGGHPVVLVLIENGVAAALPDASPALTELRESGGRLWVDAFSLTQRALEPADLTPEARLVEMDDVAAKLLEPAVRAVWH